MKGGLVVSFEGAIGAGKSTLLERLDGGVLQGALNARMGPAAPRVVCVREPVAQWRERGWLAKFYADPATNAAAFQMLAFMSRVDAIERELAPGTLLLVERSRHSDRIFWDLQRRAGHTTASDLYDEAYRHVWDRYTRWVPDPSLVVLVRTTHLDDTMARVRARGRGEESGVTLDYQQKLLDLHLERFAEPVAHPPDAEPIPCWHLMADEPHHTDDALLAKLVDELARRIAELK